MKSEKEIKKEIEALEACKSYIPKRTMFGDDNIAKVDLQIRFLRGEIDIDESSAEWEEDYNQDEQSSILEARDWKEGQIDESPSSGWENFKVSAKKK